MDNKGYTVFELIMTIAVVGILGLGIALAVSVIHFLWSV